MPATVIGAMRNSPFLSRTSPFLLVGSLPRNPFAVRKKSPMSCGAQWRSGRCWTSMVLKSPGAVTGLQVKQRDPKCREKRFSSDTWPSHMPEYAWEFSIGNQWQSATPTSYIGRLDFLAMLTAGQHISMISCALTFSKEKHLWEHLIWGSRHVYKII